MTEPVRPQSAELQERWDRDGALNHVWRALSLSQAVDCVDQMSKEAVDLPPDKVQARGAMLGMMAKLADTQIDKELVKAYEELRSYLKTKGLLPDA